MNNREMDRLIAEKVMGCTLQITGGDFNRWIFPNGNRLGNDQWSPSTDITAAWDVVEKLGGLGYWAQLRTPFDLAENNDGYWCGFTPHLTTGWNGRPDHWTNAPTITMAICLAALKCVGV